MTHHASAEHGSRLDKPDGGDISSREALHALAREFAAKLLAPDKKQLRFNEIVEAALDFYAGDPRGGVTELVSSCDRACPDLYVQRDPMWQSLRRRDAWMLA